MVPFALSYVFTHTARAFVPEVELGKRHESVSFTTSDGLELSGWYIPSENRAAVIAFPGRSGPQRPARMLARHGYGVLLFDRRGEGESDGDPNIFGWAGERDLRAAVEFLRRRPDVDPERIGGIGLSVGGEMMIEAAAESDGLKAVVSEGAGIRSLRESLAIPETRMRIEASLVHLVLTPGVALFSNTLPPPSLEDLIGRIAPRPVFIIYAVPGQGGEAELSQTFYNAAREPKTIWQVPGRAYGRHRGAAGGIRAARGRVLRRRPARRRITTATRAQPGGRSLGQRALASWSPTRAVEPSPVLRPAAVFVASSNRTCCIVAAMIRFIVRTAITLAGSAVGLLVAGALLDGVDIDAGSFILAVVIFTISVALLTPFLANQLRRSNSSALGGVALIATLAGLIITDLLSDGFSIDGVGTWLAAMVIVWVASLAAVFILPYLGLKKYLEER